MFPDYSYKWIYVITVAVLTLTSLGTRRSPYEKESPVPSLLFAILLTIFIGGRPHSFRYFGDTYNYAHWWGGGWSGFRWETENVLFDNINANMAYAGMTATNFFYVIASIYFLAMWLACRKLFPNHTLLAFLVCLGAFSTYSYGTNGIKAGASASLFLVALAYRDRLIISLIFLALSRGFHHSMTMSVVAYAITLYFRNSKWYFYGWLFCLVMAAGHVTFFQSLFAGMADSGKSDAYLNTSDASNWGGKSGFRLDFVLYSSMPVVFGHYVINKFKLRDDLYEKMLHLYMATNGVWMLCMYGAFTNRIAYLSWMMYPMLIAYPCLQVADQNHPILQNRNNYIMAHLAFTLFAAIFLF